MRCCMWAEEISFWNNCPNLKHLYSLLRSHMSYGFEEYLHSWNAKHKIHIYIVCNGISHMLISSYLLSGSIWALWDNFQMHLVVIFQGISSTIAFTWMARDPIDDKINNGLGKGLGSSGSQSLPEPIVKWWILMTSVCILFLCVFGKNLWLRKYLHYIFAAKLC